MQRFVTFCDETSNETTFRDFANRLSTFCLSTFQLLQKNVLGFLNNIANSE